MNRKSLTKLVLGKLLLYAMFVLGTMFLWSFGGSLVSDDSTISVIFGLVDYLVIIAAWLYLLIKEVFYYYTKFGINKENTDKT